MSRTLPPVAKVVRVAYQGLLDASKPWRTAFHLGWEIGSSITAEEILDMATAMSGAWNTHVKPSTASSASLTETICQALDSDTAPQAFLASSIAGTNADTSLAGGTAMVVSRKTGRRYRGGHSRVYLPGIPHTTLAGTEDAFSSATANAYRDLWAAVEGAGVTYLNSIGKSDAASVAVKYFHGFTNVLYPTGRYHAIPNIMDTPLVDKVIQFEAQRVPGSQRRRQSGR